MITVIALVFSLTIVALQISSTQFSPRLLRNFLRDRPIQVVLSVFVSTFAYSTAGLFTIGVERNGREFVPGVAVAGALLLGFASLGMLVFYIHHVAHSIQVDTIMEKVQLQTLAVAACMHPDLLAGPESVDAATPPADTPPDAFVTAHRPGYVQTVDIPEVTALAERYGCSIRVPFRAGQHVNRGTLVAAVWQRTPAGQPRSPALAEALRGAIRTGFERTLEQDVRFGIRQLVDIACKALSPAINDPYTAVQATDRLSVVLVDLAHRETGDRLVYDDEGRLLVAATLPAFDTYLDLACGQNPALRVRRADRGRVARPPPHRHRQRDGQRDAPTPGGAAGTDPLRGPGTGAPAAGGPRHGPHGRCRGGRVLRAGLRDARPGRPAQIRGLGLLVLGVYGTLRPAAAVVVVAGRPGRGFPSGRQTVSPTVTGRRDRALARPVPPAADPRCPPRGTASRPGRPSSCAPRWRSRCRRR